jgi:hypothetical protein
MKAREGDLYLRNEELLNQLHQPIIGGAQGIFTISLDKPMGLGLTSDAAVDNVKPGGQGEAAGICPGSQILSIGGIEVLTLRSIKVAIKRCRDRGDETVDVEYEGPVAAALRRAEDEHLLPDEELQDAKERLDYYGSPDGPDEEQEYEESDSPEEGIESNLLAVPVVHVYRISQQSRTTKSSEWGANSVWSGKLVIVQTGDLCVIRLLDSSTGVEFAQAPVVSGAVAPAEDSSNGFALQCVNRLSGQKIFVGIKFSNNDKVNFEAALQSFAEYNKKKGKERGRKERENKEKTFFGPESLGNDGNREEDECANDEKEWMGLRMESKGEGADNESAVSSDEDEDDAPRFGGGFGGTAEDDLTEFKICEQCGERVPLNNVRPHVCITLCDNLSNEVKLMKVRGQRHGASLPRGHEEVKSSMHANIDGFRKELQKGVEVVKLNKKDMKTGSRVLSISGENLTTLVCKNKKKLMGFSKEMYDLTQLERVQFGESPDPDGQTKWDMGTPTLRQHAEKNELVKQMQAGGQCFSLIFPERSIDFAAQSKAERDFLAGGFELMVGKGQDFGKLFNVTLRGRGMMGIGLSNDWTKGYLLLTKVDHGSESHALDLKPGDKVVSVNNDDSWAMKDAAEASKALAALPR